MDIVVEQVPEPQSETVQEPTQADAPEPTPASPQAPEAREVPPDHTEPQPKKRGRPPGSKNKPKIIERVPTPEPVQTEVEEDEPPSPKKKRAARPKAAPKQKAPRTPPEQPTLARDGVPPISTPLQVAASMLEILRLEQAERHYRKGQLYKSWIQ